MASAAPSPPLSPSSRAASTPSSPVIATSTIASSSSASAPGIPLTLSNRVLWSGELSVKPSSFLGKWKTRFFVLRPFTIDIYEDLVGLFNALPVASIPLIHINGAIASTDGSDSNKEKETSPPTSPRSKQNKKVGLTIPTLSKVWTLMTSHIEERDEWITQLNNALSLLSLSSSGRKTTSAGTPPLIKRLPSSSVDENDVLPNSAPSDDSHLAAALNDITDTSSSDTVAAATAISASNIQIPAAIINDNPSVPTPEDIIANSLSIGHPECDTALAYESLCNYNAAIVHWQKANQDADKHPLALWRIANRVWWGWNCKRDPEVAKKLWEVAAQKGQVGALARCYQFGLGGKTIDERKAYSMMFEFATKNNDVDSQCVIGTYYDHGTGVSKDSKLAISYYQRAASKGHAPSLFNLGICYMTGVGVSQNALEGCFFFKKATESNHGAAAYNLGLSYKIGAGVKKNDEKSKQWITKANEWGHVGQYSHMGKETEDSVDLSLSTNPALQGFAR